MNISLALVLSTTTYMRCLETPIKGKTLEPYGCLVIALDGVYDLCSFSFTALINIVQTRIHLASKLEVKFIYR